jgi:hypothetical protein
MTISGACRLYKFLRAEKMQTLTDDVTITALRIRMIFVWKRLSKTSEFGRLFIIYICKIYPTMQILNQQLPSRLRAMPHSAESEKILYAFTESVKVKVYQKDSHR